MNVLLLRPRLGCAEEMNEEKCGKQNDAHGFNIRVRKCRFRRILCNVASPSAVYKSIFHSLSFAAVGSEPSQQVMRDRNEFATFNNGHPHT
jgi:hypothetical protein